MDCLDRLRQEIEGKGGVVLFRFGQILDSLNELHHRYNIHTIYGNEESGLQWSWNRDKSVAKWCNENDVLFKNFHRMASSVGYAHEMIGKPCATRRIDSSLVEAPQRIRDQTMCSLMQYLMHPSLDLRFENCTNVLNQVNLQPWIHCSRSLTNADVDTEKVCQVQSQEKSCAHDCPRI